MAAIPPPPNKGIRHAQVAQGELILVGYDYSQLDTKLADKVRPTAFARGSGQGNTARSGQRLRTFVSRVQPSSVHVNKEPGRLNEALSLCSRQGQLWTFVRREMPADICLARCPTREVMFLCSLQGRLRTFVRGETRSDICPWRNLCGHSCWARNACSLRIGAQVFGLGGCSEERHLVDLPVKYGVAGRV
jgi:hypothetical protein